MWKGKWIFVTSLVSIVLLFPIFSMLMGAGNPVFNFESLLSIFTSSPLVLLYFPMGIFMLFGIKSFDGIALLVVSSVLWYSLLGFLSYKASHVKKYARRYIIAIIVLILLTFVGCISQSQYVG